MVSGDADEDLVWRSDRKIDLEVGDGLCRPHRRLQWVRFGERQLGVGKALRRWFWYDHIVMETRYCWGRLHVR